MALIETQNEGSLKSIVNLTGTVLHTNLGRATLPPFVADQLSGIASGNNNLEYELETQLSDGIDEKYSNSITDAVEEYADDVLPSLVAKSIDNTDVFTDVEDLLNEKFEQLPEELLKNE